MANDIDNLKIQTNDAPFTTIDFSKEEQDAIQQNIDSRNIDNSQGFTTISFTPEQQQELEESLASRHIKFSPYLQNPPKANAEPFLDYLKKADGYYDVMTLGATELPPLPQNATEEEKELYAKTQKKQSLAKAMMGFFAYNLDVNSEATRAELEDIQRKTLSQYDLKDPEELKKVIVNSYIIKKFNSSLNEFGALPEKVLFDKRFVRYVDKDSYGVCKQIYDLYQEKLGLDESSYSASYRRAQASRVLNQKLVRGEISYDEYELENYTLNLMNTRYDESEVMAGIGGIVSGMVSAVADNPLLAIAGATAGAVTAVTLAPTVTTAGAVVAGIGGLTSGAMSLPSFFDTVEQSLADSVAQVRQYEKEHNIKPRSLDDIKYEALASAYAVGAIDLASDIVGGLVAVPLKVLTEVGSKSLTKAVTKLTNKAVAKNAVEGAVKEGAGQAVADGAQEVVKTWAEKQKPQYLKEFGKIATRMSGVGVLNTGVQTGSEALQDAITSNTASGILGLSDEERYERMFNASIDTARDVWGPMAVLSAFGVTPRTLTSVYKVVKSKDNIVKQQVLESISAIQKDSIKDPNAQAALFDSVAENKGMGKRYLSSDAVDSILEELGADSVDVLGEDLASQIRQAQEKGEMRDDFSISVGDLNNLNPKIREAIYQNSSERVGGETASESRRNIDSVTSEQIQSEIKAQRANIDKREEELNKIQADLNNRMMGVADAKGIDFAGYQHAVRLYTSFLSGISKITGLSALDLHSRFAPEFRMQDNLENATDNLDANDAKKVNGAYVFDKNAIILAKHADFATLMHEMSHFFFSSLDKIAKDDSLSLTDEKKNNLKEFVSVMKKYGGLDEDADLANLKDEKVAKAHEKLVGGFLYYIMSGESLDPDVKKLFSGFKRLLTSIKNHSLYRGLTNKARAQDMQAKGYKNKGEYVKEHYKESVDAQGFEDFPPEMKALINAMFKVEQEKIKMEAFYSSDSVLGEMLNNPNISEETKTEIKQRQQELIKEIDERLTQNANEELNIFLSASGQISQVYKQIISFVGESLPYNKAKEFYAFLSKNKAIAQRIKKRTSDLVENLKKTDVYVALDLLRENKISLESMRGLEHKQDYIEKLRANRFISVSKNIKGAIDVKDLPRIFKNFIPSEYLKDNLTVYDCLNFLANPPDIRKQAISIAIYEEVQRLKRDPYNNEYAKDLKALSVRKRTALGNSERKALKQIAGDKKTVKAENDMLVKSAKEDVSNTPISQINFRSIAKRASECRNVARDCIAKGQGYLNKAIKFLANERFHDERLINATLRINNIKSDFKNLISLVSKSDKDLAKRGYDVDTINVVRAVLNNIHMGRFVGIDGQIITYKNIKNFGQRKDESVCDVGESFPAIGDFLINDVFRNDAVGALFNSSWLDQNVGDVEYILSRLNAVMSIARNARTATVNGKRILLEEQTKELSESLAKHKSKAPSMRGIDSKHEAGTVKKPRLTKLASYLRDYFGITKRIENLCILLDKSFNGSFSKYVFRPVMTAYTDMKMALNEIAREQTQALNKVEKFATEAIIESEVDGLRIKDQDGNSKLAEWGTNEFKGATTIHLLGVLWQLGTNYEHFLNNWIADDYGSISEKDRAVKLWLNRMIDAGHITKGMLECIQDLSRLNAKVAVKANDAHYELTGFRFKELASKKWKTKLGTFEIGYAPLIRNTNDIPLNASGDIDLSNPANLVDQTSIYGNNSPSFSKDRSKGAKYRQSLNLANMMSATSRVASYSFMQPAVVSVYKMLNLKRLDTGTSIRGEMDRKYPGAYKLIEGWLKDNAMMRDKRELKHLDNLLSKAVSLVGISAMAGNINNAIQGLSQIFTTLSVASPSELLKALGGMVLNPKALRATIDAESKYMKLRHNDVNNGINTLFAQTIYNWRKFDTAGARSKALWNNFSQFSKNHAYFMQKIVTDYVDGICYTAVRNTELKKLEQKYMNEHPDMVHIPKEDMDALVKEAQARAESATRLANGSLDMPSVSMGERGNAIQKMFLQFGSFFFSMAQLLTSKIIVTCADEGVAQWQKALLCAYHFSAIMILPAITAQAINEFFTQQSEDDEDFWLTLGASPFKQWASALPYVGKSMNAVIDEAIGKKYYNANLMDNPLMVFASSNYRAGKNIFDLIFSDEKRAELKGRDVRAVMNIIALISGNPAFSFASRPASYMTDYWLENIDPVSSFDFGRGVITGIASAESKK